MSYSYRNSWVVSGSNTLTVAPTAGDLILIYTHTSVGGGSPTVTFSDNSSSTWVTTSVNASNVGTSGGNYYSFGYCLAANSGVTTITATFNNGTPGTCFITAIAYSGMTSPSYEGISAVNVQTNPGTGANAIVGGTNNVTAQPALVIGLTDNDSGPNAGYTAGAGYTIRYTGATTGVGIEDLEALSTGNQTATFTNASHGTENFVTWTLAFAEGGGGPAGPAPLYYQRKVLYFI